MEFINTPLLRKAVEWAEEQAALPEGQSLWLQAWWVIPEDAKNKGHRDLRKIHNINPCGTAYCIAGRICAIEEGEQALAEGYHRRMGDRGDDAEYREAMRPAWAQRAAEYLNVPVTACEVLFRGENRIADVRQAAETLVSVFGEPGEHL